MKLIKIDKATPDDIPTLIELLSVLFTQEEDFTADPEAQIRGLAKIIDHPETGIIILARQNKKIVGMVNLLFTVSTVLGERVALLEDMVIAASFRGTGIGTQLLAGAISYAKSESCGRITLLTDKTNQAAQRFYEKQGFATSSMIPMRLCF